MIGNMKPVIVVTFKDEGSKRAFDAIVDRLRGVFRNPSYHILEWEDQPGDRIFSSGLYGFDVAKAILDNKHLIDKMYRIKY